MKLIIIYGPPAAGKLTVANAIAERTGIKVFHNHLSIDCVKPVIEFGTPAFWPKEKLEPVIAQYKADHPPQPARPVPMCEGNVN